MTYDVRTYRHFIGGDWVESTGGERIESRCPGDNEVIATLQSGTREDVDRAVDAARACFDEGEWGHDRNRPSRAELLRKVAARIRENAEELARLEALDNGKPVGEAFLIDIPLAADTFDYYADQVSGMRSGEIIPLPGEALDFTLREPIGVCGQIVPWNFPLMFFAWKVAPALAAGNTVVYKPSEMTSITSLEVTKIMVELGVPRGALNVVTGYGDPVGMAISEHTGIDKVSFTGSTAVGRDVTRRSASNLKKLTMELGGKSPNVVFADCDLDQAVTGAMNGVFLNQGEQCCAGSRLLVEQSIHDEFVARLAERVAKINVGHPADWEAKMGALVSPQHKERVLGYIASGKKDGARLVCGGGVPDHPALVKGNFVEPTIFDGVTPEMTIAREEIFGPVVAVMTFDTEEEAVALANDTCYGLAAGVWTRDIKRALRVTRRLRAGMVWVNNFNMVSPHTPFGGYKQSGYGKDLGREALLDYTQVKNVYIELGDDILTPYE